ncbi:MAG: hypothetical protein LBV20_02735, partial [Treponema sp.]|nr:hypothetical protein [Treponema sp.]
MNHYLKPLIFFLSFLLIFSLPVFGIDASRELENQRIEFIKSSLDTQEIAYEERSLFTNQGGFGKSIHIVYSPVNANAENLQEQLVLAVPLSTQNDTEEIERFDIKTALYIAEQLKHTVPAMHVRIAFLGDEYSSLPEDVTNIKNIGLSDLLSLYDTPENVIVCYLDLPFAPGALNIHHGSQGIVAPLNIVEPLTDAFEKTSIPYSLYIKFNELYKLSLIQ